MFADIQSSNIVGYTSSVAEQGKFKIFTASFETVGGGMDVNDLLSSGITGVGYDEDNVFKTTAAQIQIPTAKGYDVYYYLNDGWYEDEKGQEAYKAGWCDDYGVIVSADITPGVAYWFKSPSVEANPTVAGAVVSDDTAQVMCPETFALRGNVFPIAVEINGGAMTSSDIKGVSYDESNAFKATAPQIQIPTAKGYDVYYYLNDGWYEDENGQEAYKAGWCDDYGVIVSATVPAMQGFWTKGVSSPFTLTFTK